MGFNVSRAVPLFLTRAAAILLAGLLLLAVTGHARAAGDGNYGLKRFPGDNYDTIPAPTNSLTQPSFAPVPGSSVSPNGYYSTLNSSPAAVTVSPPPAYTPQPATAPQAYAPAPSYTPAPASGDAYGYKPAQGYAPLAQGYGYKPEQGGQPQAAQAYGYKPDAGYAAAPPPAASYAPASAEPYGYKPVMPAAPSYPRRAWRRPRRCAAILTPITSRKRWVAPTMPITFWGRATRCI
ncbi:MAG: hypothetical protein U1E93_05025 [Alphaproteobacteria bacterium]